MKALTPFLLSAALVAPAISSADVVTAAEADTLVGKTSGAWAGILLGGAAGGPLGALAMGIAGAWSGSEVQKTAGLSATAYRVKRDDGSEVVVRSPNRQWSLGDQVEIEGNRLVPASQLAAAQ